MFQLLSDRWDNMNGVYLGKDYSSLSLLLDEWEVENRKEVIFFLKHYESFVIEYRNKKLDKQRKSEERKNKAAYRGK